MKIACMIPCYNEAECIGETTRELMQELKRLSHQYECILIDHGSTDGTGEQLKILQKEYPQSIRVISLEKNIGYGAIINKGLREYTKGDLIGWTCADGEIKAEDTVKIIEFLLQNSEYAAVKASRINRNKGFRKFISLWYNRFVESLFSIDTKDVNGWPFFIKSSAFQELDIKSKNWIINIEILNKLQQKKQKFKDIECAHQQRKGSRSKVSVFTIFSFLYQVAAYKVSTFGKNL